MWNFTTLLEPKNISFPNNLYVIIVSQMSGFGSCDFRWKSQLSSIISLSRPHSSNNERFLWKTFFPTFPYTLASPVLCLPLSLLHYFTCSISIGNVHKSFKLAKLRCHDSLLNKLAHIPLLQQTDGKKRWKIISHFIFHSQHFIITMFSAFCSKSAKYRDERN